MTPHDNPDHGKQLYGGKPKLPGKVSVAIDISAGGDRGGAA